MTDPVDMADPSNGVVVLEVDYDEVVMEEEYAAAALGMAAVPRKAALT